jgi:flagellar hook-basal body complex protein FliE
MTVTPLARGETPGLDVPLVPDVPLAPNAEAAGSGFAGALLRALETAGGALERAGRAESAFAGGRGGLQEMILERAQADVALSLATAAASRTVQALSTILGMQV